MKSLNLLNMGVILTGLALTACEDGGRACYGAAPEIKAEKEYSDEFLEVFRFTVKARNWQSVSSSDRFAEVSLPAITDSIIREGAVMVYLHEAAKCVALPFTYYQMRRATLFEPSYEEGRVYVNILGNFILNVSTSYTFSVFVIRAAGLRKYKYLDWRSFEEARQTLRKPGNSSK